MMRQVSRPVRWGAGRKGRQDLARSLPGFKVLGVLYLAEVSLAFLPSKKACWTHKFRHLGVGQQYPLVFRDKCGAAAPHFETWHPLDTHRVAQMGYRRIGAK